MPDCLWREGMSDYDFDDDHRSFLDKHLTTIIAVCVVIPIVTFAFYNAVFPSNAKQVEEKAFETKWNQVQTQITQMNCQQLQKLRLDHIAGKDITPYGDHWDSVRDSYNALSCGTHWSYWEN